MSYQDALDLLSKIIEEKEKEAPFKKSTTAHYLVKVLYRQHCLLELFKEYLTKRVEGYCGKLFSESASTTLALGNIEELNELSDAQMFLIISLAEQSATMSHMMSHIDEKAPTLEDVLRINNFIVENVKEILKVVPQEFDPKGTDYCEESMAWWTNK